MTPSHDRAHLLFIPADCGDAAAFKDSKTLRPQKEVSARPAGNKKDRATMPTHNGAYLLLEDFNWTTFHYSSNRIRPWCFHSFKSRAVCFPAAPSL